MKLFLSAIGLCLITLGAFAQVNPTLSVGLEALTMNKGTIDVKVLTEIIMEKQNELRQEALKRFMLSLFPETNYTTRFYVQNCLHILLNEKNSQVIEKQILELTTNYALALGVAKIYYDKKEQDLAPLYTAYTGYKFNSPVYRAKMIDKLENFENNEKDVKSIEKDIALKDTQIVKLLREEIKDVKPNASNIKAYKKLRDIEDERKNLEKKLNRQKLRKSASYNAGEIEQNKLPFGIMLDVVSLSLSKIESLKEKGFYKVPIDYRNDAFYLELKNSKDKKDSLLQKELDKLQVTITNQVKPYIENYDVIKELFLTNNVSNGPSIKNELITYYTQLMQNIAGTDNFVKIVTGSFSKELDKSLSDSFEKYKDSISRFQTHLNNARKYEILLTGLKNYKNQYKAIRKDPSLSSYTSFGNDSARIINNFKATFQPGQTPFPIDSFKVDISSTDSVYKIRYSFKTAYDKLRTLKKISSNFEIQRDSANRIIKKLDSVKVTLNAMAESITDSINFTERESAVLAAKQTIQDVIVNNAKNIVETGNFLGIYLNEIINKLADIKTFTVTASDTSKTHVADYTNMLAETYQRLTDLANQTNISVTDINYIEDKAIPQLIKFGLIFKNDSKNIAEKVKEFRLLSQLLKIKAVLLVGELKGYNTSLVDLFKFISNLDQLDRAETYQSMVNLFRDINKDVQDNLDDGKFKDVYTLFSNGINKYTLVNTKEEYVEIDVVSFLTDLQQYFDRNNSTRFGLYLTLGLNQNIFFRNASLPGTNANEELKYIGFASEKIGVKFSIIKARRVRDYENAVKNDVNLNKRAAFITDWYTIIYGSGLLYSIANTSTSVNFDYPHIGFGTGLRFFNSLDVSAVVGMPFVKDQPIYRNLFYGIAMDIPLGQYLERLNRKN